MRPKVPKISVNVRRAEFRSDARLPVRQADTCASWRTEDRHAGQKLLRTRNQVSCLDATAFVAVTALALHVTMNSQTVTAKIVKAYDQGGTRGT